jgi:hypothetical protein
MVYKQINITANLVKDTLHFSLGINVDNVFSLIKDSNYWASCLFVGVQSLFDNIGGVIGAIRLLGTFLESLFKNRAITVEVKAILYVIATIKASIPCIDILETFWKSFNQNSLVT